MHYGYFIIIFGIVHSVGVLHDIFPISWKIRMQAVATSYPNFELISLINNGIMRVFMLVAMTTNTLIRMFWNLRSVLQDI